MNFKLGVMLESFQVPWREAIIRAAQTGVDGVQIRAVDGELSVDIVTEEIKRELRSRLAENGLEISALCGDLGKGFGNREHNGVLI